MARVEIAPQCGLGLREIEDVRSVGCRDGSVRIRAKYGIRRRRMIICAPDRAEIVDALSRALFLLDASLPEGMSRP